MRKTILFYQKHKSICAAITFVFFILVSACNFPIYNLLHEWSRMLAFYNVLAGVFLYAIFGAAEAQIFPKFRGWHILLLNLMLVLLGMGARYLLEFGEVSNTYNFTAPNIFLHIFATVTLSTLFWLWVAAKGKNKQTK